MPENDSAKVIVGISGASGAIYGVRLLERLRRKKWVGDKEHFKKLVDSGVPEDGLERLPRFDERVAFEPLEFLAHLLARHRGRARHKASQLLVGLRRVRQQQQELAGDGLELLPAEGNPEPLQEVRDMYAFLERELPKLFDRWEVERPTMGTSVRKEAP